MADLDDVNHQIFIFDGVDNSVSSLSNPVFVLPREFFTSRRAGILFETQDKVDYPLAIPFRGNGLDFFDR
jgi:hypothetical protein